MRALVRGCEKNWVQRSGDSSGQWGRALLRAEVVREKTAWLKSLKVRCSYIGSGEKTRRHGERAGRREGAKRDDEVTVPVWFLTGRGGD